MGTGSHRPQWEAARGRADATGGIRHARALPSHTKLKRRRAGAAARAAPDPGPYAAIAAPPGEHASLSSGGSPLRGSDARDQRDGGPAKGPAGGSAEDREQGPKEGLVKSPEEEGSGTPEEARIRDAEGAEGADADADSADSEEELRRELDLINRRQALRAQRAQHAQRDEKPAAAWRSEAAFKRARPARKRGAADAARAEHREFLNKYLR